MDDEADGGSFRRLPARVRPTVTEHDVTPPVAAPEVKYVSGLSPAGSVQAYSSVADFVTRTPRRDWRRTAILVILGLALLSMALTQVL